MSKSETETSPTTLPEKGDESADLVVGKCATCKIQIEETDRRRYVKIQPLGFWADVVKVGQSIGWGETSWGEIEISWSAGGTDGTL